MRPHRPAAPACPPAASRQPVPSGFKCKTPKCAPGVARGSRPPPGCQLEVSHGLRLQAMRGKSHLHVTASSCAAYRHTSLQLCGGKTTPVHRDRLHTLSCKVVECPPNSMLEAVEGNPCCAPAWQKPPACHSLFLRCLPAHELTVVRRENYTCAPRPSTHTILQSCGVPTK